jgi:hypothetical protein
MMTTVSLKECGGRDNVVPTQFHKCQLTPLTLYIYLFIYLLIYIHFVTYSNTGLVQIIQVK